MTKETHVRGISGSDMVMKLDDITRFLDGFLGVKVEGEDTGLKLSGRPDIHKVGAAVDLSLCAIDEANAAGCDLLLVHHDAWRSTDADLAEKKYRRLTELGLSLYVSHDPLDKHEEVGTAVCLAQALDWTVEAPFCGGVGVLAAPSGRTSLDQLAAHVETALGSQVNLVAGNCSTERIGVIAGWGARPEWMAEARAMGAATFLSGEAIHFGKLYAKESGMNLILAGHYATELPAVRALLERVATECDVEREWNWTTHSTLTAQSLLTVGSPAVDSACLQ